MAPRNPQLIVISPDVRANTFAEFAATLKAINFVAVGAIMQNISRRLDAEFRVWPQEVKAANSQPSHE